MASIGLSGVSMSHTDIGGYTDLCAYQIGYERSASLLKRWMESSAFLDAVFRTHPGSKPSCNAQVNSSSDVLRHFSKFAQVHGALNPYRSQLMAAAAATGAPLMRHPWMHFWNKDARATKLTTQFMLGPDLMVAPVLSWEANFWASVKVYLPRDPQGKSEWTHLWSGKQYQGGAEYDVAAPEGEPPVFVNTSVLEGSTMWQQVVAKIRQL